VKKIKNKENYKMKRQLRELKGEFKSRQKAIWLASKQNKK